MVDQNMCPVCGYGMEEPPEQYNICSSCGTEFGVHDVNASIEELRLAWLRTGPKWFSAVDPEPQDWSPYLQVRKAIAAHGSFPETSIRSDTGVALGDVVNAFAGNDPGQIRDVDVSDGVASDTRYEEVFV